MKTKEKITLGFIIASLVLAVLCIALCTANAFKITIDGVGGDYTGKMFAVIFGGFWQNSSASPDTNFPVKASPALVIGFILLVLAIILIIVLLYDFFKHKLKNKYRLILACVVFVFLLASSIIVCFSKDFIANTYLAATETKKEFKDLIKDSTTLSPAIIMIIVFDYLATVCAIAGIAINIFKIDVVSKKED